MTKIERYKKRFGDGDVTVRGHIIEIPAYLIWLFVHTRGLKSRKWRLIKKILKQEAMRALYAGIEKDRKV